jgi:hypothetical protein
MEENFPASMMPAYEEFIKILRRRSTLFFRNACFLACFGQKAASIADSGGSVGTSTPVVAG